MTQVHSVRVKKWTQLRPEDFNGTASASLNARRRHTASPEPPPHPLSDSPPASPELPRYHSASPPPYPPASYVYHQHVYYQSPSHSPSPTRPYSHHPSDYDSQWPWRDQDSSAYHLPSPHLPPSPTTTPDSPVSRRALRHTSEDHYYNPYSRPSSRGSRPLSKSHPLSPLFSSQNSDTTLSSSLSSSQLHDHTLPSYELHTPPLSPRSPILSMRHSKTAKTMDTMKTMKTMNPLISAVEEEMTETSSVDCQDSVVPSVQKMKICNLLLND